MTVASVHYYDTDDALPAYYGDASPTAHAVGQWPEWQPYLGRRLQRLEHVGHPDFPWRIAVRLAFDDATTVTVALGDTDEPGDLAYSIDNLLVFHDDRTARAYLDFLRTVPESFAMVLPAADLERPPP